MRKLLAIILLLLLFIPQTTASAANIDFSTMSDPEILDIIDSARAELIKRKAEGYFVLVDQDGVLMYQTGNYTIKEYSEIDITMQIEVVITNNRDVPITILDNGTSVNGWAVDLLGTSSIPSGKSKKDYISFNLYKANITQMEEIHEVEYCFKIYNDNDFMNPIIAAPSIYVR